MAPANPNHTPPRSIRIEEGLWQEAKTVAARRDETLTDVIADALRRYVRRHKP